MSDLENLKRLLHSAEAEERRLATARDHAEAEHASAKEKVDLLRRLIGLTNGSSRPAEAPGPAKSSNPPGPTKSEAGTLEDRVQEILASTGTPIHVRKIRQALIDAGVPLPGRGDEANIIVRLARDTNRFMRTGRGTYGLRAWGGAEVRPTRKRRVSRGTT